jgi:hypothetical protein
MNRACHLLLLKKLMRNSAPKFAFENVCDKTVFVS